MTENEIATKVVDAAYHVHARLGAGLLESVYQEVLALEIRRRGLGCEAQVRIPVDYDELHFVLAFRADLATWSSRIW
jgi:GxxExxY protein